jgi:hypothetical protein
MARKYREVNTDAECNLVLAGCDCEGYDVVETCRKDPPYWSKFAACSCGRRRARKKTQGGWSVVIDDAVYAKMSVIGRPDMKSGV